MESVDTVEAGLRSYLDGLLAARSLPGYALAASHPYGTEVELVGGYRDIDTGLPVTGDTQFAVFSITKVVTALAALRMVARGELHLETPVADLLPGWTDRGASSPILLRHLLSHTAGLTYGSRPTPVQPDYLRAGFLRGSPDGLTGAALYRTFSNLPRLFAPGHAWSYSLASDVVGWVLSEVSGIPLGDVLRREVFRPLGMTRSGLISDPGERVDAALVYRPWDTNGGGTWQVAETAMRDWGRPAAAPSGGGGLLTTIRDLHRLTAAIAVRDGDLLPADVWHAGTTNHVPCGCDLATGQRYSPLPGRASAGVGYGLGMAVVLDGAVCGLPGSDGELGWEGSTGGFLFAHPASGRHLAFLTNVFPAHHLTCWFDLRRIMYRAGPVGYS